MFLIYVKWPFGGENTEGAGLKGLTCNTKTTSSNSKGGLRGGIASGASLPRNFLILPPPLEKSLSRPRLWPYFIYLNFFVISKTSIFGKVFKAEFSKIHTTRSLCKAQTTCPHLLSGGGAKSFAPFSGHAWQCPIEVLDKERTQRSYSR